jgi:hypothetical protein
MPETVVHFQLRMPPELHERLSNKARTGRVSLNALIVQLLDTAARVNGHEDGRATLAPRAADPPRQAAQ